MSDLFVLCAFISSAVFLIARHPYAAVAGWAFVAANLWSELPAFLKESNFLYPALALLSLPFLAVTAERLVRKDPAVLQLSRTASIATVIYVPFSLIPVLHDTLIAVVVTQAFALITALGHSPQLVSWDVIYENAFANKIILGCTGIMAIAMMLGVVFGEKSLTARQAVLSVLLVV
ncbi:MAG TPA: archaeosortase A, partial [Methanoregula sp.]|nr:archaeosortase A [Methanoregula sp.]